MHRNSFPRPASGFNNSIPTSNGIGQSDGNCIPGNNLCYFFLQSSEAGARLPQAIASFIPLVSGPQAVVCAERAASVSVECDAEAQLCRPL